MYNSHDYRNYWGIFSSIEKLLVCLVATKGKKWEYLMVAMMVILLAALKAVLKVDLKVALKAEKLAGE
jgi:hypothetical protein